VNALHSKKSRYDRKKHSEAAQYEQKRVLSGSVQDKYSLCLTNVTVQTPADIFLPWVSGSLVATDEIEEKWVIGAYTSIGFACKSSGMKCLAGGNCDEREMKKYPYPV
jgi:hypothetical protein